MPLSVGANNPYSPKRVDPITARRGVFLKSFSLDEYHKLIAYCGRTRAAMARNDIGGELVITKINQWGKYGGTWQVFLL